MVENYNMPRDVLLLHVPTRMNKMAILFTGAIPRVTRLPVPGV